MNTRLYGLRGVSTDKGDAFIRDWITREGGTVDHVRVMPLITGDQLQYHVHVDGEYWLLTPQGGTYSWFKVR